MATTASVSWFITSDVKDLVGVSIGKDQSKYTLGVFVVKPSNSPKKQTPLTLRILMSTSKGSWLFW